jgi:hypothetical protein
MGMEFLVGTATIDETREWSRGELRAGLRQAIARARVRGYSWADVEHHLERAIRQIQRELLN